MSEDYSAPATPRSFREVLQKATRDPAYADFIHDAVRRARAAETDQEKAEAVAIVDAQFKLSGEELTTLGLPVEFSAGPCRCTQTRTTFFMLDLATATAGYPPEEAS